MSMNVHGHQMPTPHGVNESNPIFHRNAPEVIEPEIPAGLHGAPALRSELEQPVPLQPKATNVDKVLAEDELLAGTNEPIIQDPPAPKPAFDTAKEAADQNAHNAAVAAEEAARVADDAAANANAVHLS